MGIRSIVLKSNEFNVAQTKKASNAKMYFQGLLTNLLNPKVALFYLAFLPQFIAKDNHFGTLPFFILGFSFIATGTIWCLSLALFSSFISNRLRQNKRISGILYKLTGILFIGLGINLFR